MEIYMKKNLQQPKYRYSREIVNTIMILVYQNASGEEMLNMQLICIVKKGKKSNISDQLYYF